VPKDDAECAPVPESPEGEVVWKMIRFGVMDIMHVYSSRMGLKGAFDAFYAGDTAEVWFKM
jgi:hypothetical protein